MQRDAEFAQPMFMHIRQAAYSVHADILAATEHLSELKVVCAESQGSNICVAECQMLNALQRVRRFLGQGCRLEVCFPEWFDFATSSMSLCHCQPCCMSRSKEQSTCFVGGQQ